jgi:hypothetical protein
MALCVIDGSRTTFSTQYLADAEDGGRRAGHSLIRAIREKIFDDNYDVNEFSIWIYIYLNKTKLFEELRAKGHFSVKADFEAFITGLNQVSPYLGLVDVADKGDADLKMRSMGCIYSDVTILTVAKRRFTASLVSLRQPTFSSPVCYHRSAVHHLLNTTIRRERLRIHIHLPVVAAC